MTDDERLKLRFGPYQTPPFKRGETVWCEIRGWVVVVGMSDAPIQWPLGRPRKARGNSSLIVTGDLVPAVQREAAQAVIHWWGAAPCTVHKWRKAFEVARVNDGTAVLRRAYNQMEWAKAARERAWAKARDPQRREKIAAAKRGKKRPPEVIEKMRKAATGRKPSAEARRKMSEAQRRRGARPPKAGRPWTEAEELLLRTLPPAEVIRRTGRTKGAVYSRRHKLGLEDARRR